MMQEAIAICGDNEKELFLLKQRLEKILHEAQVSIFSNGDALLSLVRKNSNPFDLFFIETAMPKISGIEIAREIRKTDLHVPIIFICEDDSHYKEAFEVFAFQYLIKPVTVKKLEDALKPLMKYNKKAERSLLFHYRSQVFAVKHSQIKYVSSSLHTVNFFLTDGTVEHCRGKLKDFENQLRDSSFLRCHQSFFVNMDYVVGMKSDRFILEDTIIPISRSYTKKVQKAYREYMERSAQKYREE